ncbi:xanthomonadin biosynthesis 3-hydroxybenozate--AMP ligase XanA2 [Cupriavidus sp. 8B]
MPAAPAHRQSDIVRTFPLVSHASQDSIIAYHLGQAVTVRRFLADVMRLAAELPPGGHVFNVCADRYCFTVGLCAALLAGKISLLPSTHTPEMVRQLASFAPDAFCLHDTPDCDIALPRLRIPAFVGQATDAPAAEVRIPSIPGERVMAYVFTSGSTGQPVPHRKTWGFLVSNVRAAAARLGLQDGRAYTLVGTVPPQHMYGFESTVLLALQGGIALSAAPTFYPADIRAALEAVPRPRVLVTSPVHLRALLLSPGKLPHADLVLSATAPLSEKQACEAEARLAAPLMEIYGSTETGQLATRRTAQTSAWELFPEVKLEARSEAGEDEQIWAAGGHVEQPVAMGDALELLDETRFLLHGRKADLINIAGKRTSLAYLNHQLNAIAGVEDGVFFMPDEQPEGHVQRLIALVVAPRLRAAQIQQALRERIDQAFLPRPLLFVDTLPRNATGKLPHEILAPLVAKLQAAQRRGDTA